MMVARLIMIVYYLSCTTKFSTEACAEIRVISVWNCATGSGAEEREH